MRYITSRPRPDRWVTVNHDYVSLEFSWNGNFFMLSPLAPACFLGRVFCIDVTFTWLMLLPTELSVYSLRQLFKGPGQHKGLWIVIYHLAIILKITNFKGRFEPMSSRTRRTMGLHANVRHVYQHIELNYIQSDPFTWYEGMAQKGLQLSYSFSSLGEKISLENVLTISKLSFCSVSSLRHFSL